MNKEAVIVVKNDFIVNDINSLMFPFKVRIFGDGGFLIINTKDINLFNSNISFENLTIKHQGSIRVNINDKSNINFKNCIFYNGIDLNFSEV